MSDSKETQACEEVLCVYFTRKPGDPWEYNGAGIERDFGTHAVNGYDPSHKDIREAAVVFAAHVADAEQAIEKSKQ